MIRIHLFPPYLAIKSLSNIDKKCYFIMKYIQLKVSLERKLQHEKLYQLFMNVESPLIFVYILNIYIK